MKKTVDLLPAKPGTFLRCGVDDKPSSPTPQRHHMLHARRERRTLLPGSGVFLGRHTMSLPGWGGGGVLPLLHGGGGVLLPPPTSPVRCTRGPLGEVGG